MNGLFLQGGGAKGAFQAGAIYALYKKGIKFNVVSGTSIGSVNGYFVYTGNIERMKTYYLETDLVETMAMYRVTDTVPNDFLIDELEKLSGRDENIKSFYVNYTHVGKDSLTQEVKDVAKLSKKEALNVIKYSSRLPFVCPEGRESISFDEALREYNPQHLGMKFMGKVQDGLYDGYNLDGGMVNNNFMEPFAHNKVDKLYLLVFRNDFEIPEYIKERYNEEDIVVIKRDEPFKPNDTLNYDKKFIRDIFMQGYAKAKELI